MRPVVDRGFVAQLLDRQVRHFGAAVAHHEALVRRGRADHGKVEPPLAEDRFGLGLLFRFEHHEHALLALRQHHLIGGHAGLAAWDLIEIEHHAEVALGAHLHRRAGQPGRAHVLDGDDAILGHDLEACFEQQLFRERIADLHGRPFRFGILAEFRGRHAGAMDAVASGLGAEIDDRHADAGRLGVEDLVRVGQPDRHGVDQAIAVIARMEAHRAADRRHAERIAVAADAGHDAADQAPGLVMLGIAEAERIEAGDRPRAHGEHVAQDAADAGRRALIGLDIARMIVALHLEHDRAAVADRDHAGVLARALDHVRAAGRQRPEMDLGGRARRPARG
jgi:hypothetical protein